MNLSKKEDLCLVAIKEFETNSEIYKVVDFLNKSLKDMGLIFGLTRENEKDKIAIYNFKSEEKNE